MSRDLDERALFERFSKKYQLVQSELLKKIERSNCSCDYGSTSFTTVDQVEILGEMLALEPNKRVLLLHCSLSYSRGRMYPVHGGCAKPERVLPRTTNCEHITNEINQLF